jgi:MOSC domain-containing protein YiiM
VIVGRAVDGRGRSPQNRAVTTIDEGLEHDVPAGRSGPVAGDETAGDPGTGVVVGIHVAPAAAEPMRAVASVRAIPGVGLEGDRYALRLGHWSPNTQVDRDVTLIAAEEIERLAAEHGIVLAPGETRRNVTTRGIRVNELLGRRFRIGGVVCEGTRLCEPCQYLTDLVGEPILGPLVHRGGLRARILTDGEIAIGDEVAPVSD